MASTDKRDFEKYLKFLTLKSIQIIVQSRKGELLRTASRSDVVDWFGLALPDDKAVLVELKKASQTKIPQKEAPLCVEISLKSSENDSSIIVEQWTLSIDTSKLDASAKATSVVYPKMGMMLKSLLCVTRLLPAYKLSRQLFDDWQICYRMFTGVGDKASLGAEPACIVVGHCNSQCGRLDLSVAYRKTIDSFQRFEESGDKSVSFLQEGSDSNPIGQLPPGKSIPFAQHGLYNDEAIESIPIQHFSQVMKYEKQTSLLHSLTPSLTPQVSGSPLCDTDSGSNFRVSPSQHDDFVHVNHSVKPAFAPESSPSADLSQFFEECRNPPHLDLFTSGNVVDINTALMDNLSDSI